MKQQQTKQQPCLSQVGERSALTRAIRYGLSASLLPVVFGVGVARADDPFPAILDLTTLNGENGFKVEGEAPQEFFGASVSSAGDVNGDGVTDFIIGAAYAGDDDFGAAYVVFGGQDFSATFDLATLDGQNGFKILGEAAEDILGASVSSGGDIDGDGVDDLIVGAPKANAAPGGDPGAVYVVFGGQDFSANVDLATLDGEAGFKISCDCDRDGLGFSVASAGDINDDGLADLILGAAGADEGGNEGVGVAYVVFGDQDYSATFDLATLDGQNGFKIFGEAAGDAFGASVSSAGDIDGDGVDDLIVGAARIDSQATTAAYVVFGGQGFSATFDLASLDGQNGFKIPGGEAGDAFGASVSSAGDIDGDGVDDLIVGAQQFDDDVGAAYVVFGGQSFSGTFDLATLDGQNGFKIPGQTDAARFGYSVSSAGDIDGDGVGDLIVGAPGRSRDEGELEVGAGYVVFGGQSFASTFDVTTLDGENGFKVTGEGKYLGFSVSSAGDIDGDGVDDLILGAPFGDAAYVVFSPAAAPIVDSEPPVPVPAVGPGWLALLAGLLGWMGLSRTRRPTRLG